MILLQQLKALARKFAYLRSRRPITASPKQIKAALPPPPRELIKNRVVYEGPLLTRRISPQTDTVLEALYRIYEHICLDQHLEIRNELEAFWYHSNWAVRDIPDPQDPDPERYACLACIPKLLCLAFNERIRLGLPRDAPAVITGDMMDEWKTRELIFEEEPEWVARVPPLSETLAIPHWNNDIRDFVPLGNIEDTKASPEFREKNILIWRPHVHFL